MSEIDWLDLDARLLRLLVAVVDSGSITAAARHLEVTQSAVSHQLVRLRAIIGRDLFVRSGRGIVATAEAEAMAVQARDLLRRLQGFAQSAGFDPARWRATVTVAANDFQRETLLPALAARLRAEAPGVMLRIIPSDVPTPAMLRDGHCDLVITPRPPDGADILQKRLFEDRYRVLFDPRARPAPRSLTDYVAAGHVTVSYEPKRALELDQTLAARGVVRRFAVSVSGFGAIAAFLRGSPLLATAPGRLGQGLLAEFDSVAPPLPCPRLPMYLVWHARFRDDPAHRWIREAVVAIAAGPKVSPTPVRS